MIECNEEFNYKKVTEDVFVYQHRWTMQGQNLPHHLFKSVDIDYKNKKINFEYYEAVHNNQGFIISTWAEELEKRHLNDETLLFKTFDEAGNVLYEVEFTDLRLLENKAVFNTEYFGIENPMARQVSVSYCFALPKLVACENTLKSTWSMDVFVNYQNKLDTVNVTVLDMSSVKIESQINNLDSTSSLQNLPIKLRCNTKDIKIIKTVADGKPILYQIDLNQYRDNKHVKVWKLMDVFFRIVSVTDLYTDIDLTYADISYWKSKDF